MYKTFFVGTKNQIISIFEHVKIDIFSSIYSKISRKLQCQIIDFNTFYVNFIISLIWWQNFFFFQKSTKNVFILKIYHQTDDDDYKILRGDFRLGSLSHSSSGTRTSNTELSHEITQFPIYKNTDLDHFVPWLLTAAVIYPWKMNLFDRCKTHERNGVISLVRQSLIRRSLFR